MSDGELDRTNSDSLARLLEIGGPGDRELPAMGSAEALDEVLDQRLFDLEHAPGRSIDADPMLQTPLRMLFSEPGLPLDWITRVKNGAKKWRDDVDAPIPQEIATLLYYASIAVALSRHGTRISNLDDAALRNGFECLLALTWCPDDLKKILSAALGKM
jgi:hypothetical protein